MEHRVKDDKNSIEAVNPLTVEIKTYEAMVQAAFAIQGCQDALRSMIELLKILDKRLPK